MGQTAKRSTGKKTRGPFRVVDMFSGAGGLSLGAARAGFEVCGAVENDPQALAAHRLNFPTTAHIELDVSRLTGEKLRTELGPRNAEIDGIIGGPPCQGFSCIGRNEISDPRNQLFEDFFRIVSEIRPKFFLAENVPGILNSSHAVIRRRALSYVEGEYTLLPPITIRASDFGVPTTRTRVFFFGYRPDEMRPLTIDDFAPSDGIETVEVKDALKGLPRKVDSAWQNEEDGWRIVRAYGKGFFAERLHGHVPASVGDPQALERLEKERRASGTLGTVHSKAVARRYGEIKPGKRDPISKSHKLKLNGFCPTLRAGTGFDRGRFQAVRPLHPTQPRVITPREAARLQGFPDWFQFSSTKWHSFRQIGSSVSPLLAERVLTVVREDLAEGE